MTNPYLFTSESVSMGHPDKVADQVSDAILDALLEQDPHSRVAVETMVSTGMVIIAGEITTKAYVEMPDVVRETIREIGYIDARLAFDYESCAVLVSIKKQATEIAQGVDRGGAGDQGMMFGFACRETPTLMPLPIHLAHRMVEQQAHVRREGIIPGLRPDAKSQVTIEYEGATPVRVDTIVLSTQHDRTWTERQDALKREIVEHVLKPVLGEWWNPGITVHVNPTGSFEIGGPHGDCGLTGRKIIVDTYGGRGRHGGGAFSGKDPTKVDRSAAYMARYIAKNLVAAELADICEVQFAYAIGVAEPVSVHVDCFGTERADTARLAKAVREVFQLTPRGIIESLGLRKPIYRPTARHGHFGRQPRGDLFTWERTDKVDALKKAVKG
ncbi:MAG: methionine adenosyltransferase [Leptolyngbya sp. PLA2]|nr:methionine adenosyltransferase [Leptolyngbya sp. PL-A2]MCQ3941464.1 methionine adenosyltransferase [cyanobacterium CYA1]MCZ7633029.1 methionine adenosyltransferase [Phycisphaerales bacterium]MDL1904576.1 methionine adenosyltransferase [Synechococcales cyanobacterium CNB]GIK18912.1 MAG: S-adenosylmethionine synthase [Planctomycetota bacterium]